MKTQRKSDWKLGAAVGTALSLGSAGAVAGPHGFDLHNVFHGASASFASPSHISPSVFTLNIVSPLPTDNAPPNVTTHCLLYTSQSPRDRG